MFIPGATGFISYNNNVNVDLVNGVEARYHSVSYNDPQDNALFGDRLQNTPPGRSIRLPPPTTINMELCVDFPGYEEAKLRNGQGAVEEIDVGDILEALWESTNGRFRGTIGECRFSKEKKKYMYKRSV